MKRVKSNLDEMQEQELLKIEHNGCWLAFWGLLTAMIVQYMVYGNQDFKMVAGEWIVFMGLALYLAFACVRRGIWDRKIAMNTRTNLLLSAAAGVAVGFFNAVMVFRNYPKLDGSAVAAVIVAAITFTICFAVLTILMKQTQKRKAAMEAEPEDANEL